MTTEVSALEFGKMLERVDHIAETMDRHNELLTASMACTRQLSKSLESLAQRIGQVESSWFMQPKKIGRAAMLAFALITLFAVLGVKETITLIAKAAL